MADVRELVSDSHAAGEEENGAIGEQALEAAVGALEEGSQRQEARGFSAGSVVERGGHAGALADDEGHAGDGSVGEGGVEVGGRGREFLACFEGAVGRGALRAPGYGEGVRHPEREGGDVDVGVAAGAESPRTRHGEGETACFAWEGLDGEGGDSVAGDVAVEKAEHAKGAVEEPEEDDGLDGVELWEGATDGVDVDAEEGEEG